MKLIDKDLILKEAEELKADLLVCIRGTCNPDVRIQLRNKVDAYDAMISYINSLETKEIDLVKEADRFIQTKEFAECEGSPVLCLAKHFFELGLKESKEKVPVSKDLEEAAKFCVADTFMITNEEDWNDAAIDAMNIFKSGAKWQKEKDKETIELAEDHAMLAGMEKQKELMLRGAVDGIVYGKRSNDGYIMAKSDYFNPEGRDLDYMDKIQLIILKEKTGGEE